MTLTRAAVRLAKCLAVALVCCSGLKLHAVEVIAHRANACGAAENSLKAIQLAGEAGLGTLELDVRVSRDGVVYLFHDSEVNDATLLQLDYAAIKKLVRADEAPTLGNALKVSSFKGTYLLDLKQFSHDQLPYLATTVEQAELDHKRIIFQSESVELLRAINKILPHNRYFLLDRLERRFPYLFAPQTSKIVLKTSEPFIQGVSIKGRSFLDRKYVHRLKKTGLRVFVWTINKPSRAIHYKASGVDGIITDKPLEFSHLFASEGDEKRACPER